MNLRNLFRPLILSALLALSACATDTTSPTPSGAPNDSTLNQQVTQAVQTVPGVGTDDLSVSTRNGVVTLKGKTETRTQAQDAIEAARHVIGVIKVDYDINVDQ